MSRKCETSLYDYYMHTLYATYHTTNDDTMVEIIEPLSEHPRFGLYKTVILKCSF